MEFGDPQMLEMAHNSDEWLAWRAGRPTASNASKLIKWKPATKTLDGRWVFSDQLDGYARELAAEKFVGGPLSDAWVGNDWTERGHELEEGVTLWYALQSPHEVQTGYVFQKEHAGASPDAVVGDHGLLEVKNPGAKAFVLAAAKGVASDHYKQAQMQLLVSGREWCDVVYSHPDLGKRVYHVERSDAAIEILGHAINAVLNLRTEYVCALNQ